MIAPQDHDGMVAQAELVELGEHAADLGVHKTHRHARGGQQARGHRQQQGQEARPGGREMEGLDFHRFGARKRIETTEERG